LLERSKQAKRRKAVAELSDRERFGDVWGKAKDETDPRNWVEESHTQCENYLYCHGIIAAIRATAVGEKVAPIDLPERYWKTAGGHARRRIVAAGMRLAAILRQPQAKSQEVTQLLPLLEPAVRAIVRYFNGSGKVGRQ
jgi:hypothetical protein